MTKKELWFKLKNYHFEDIVPPSLWEHITATFQGTDASTKAFADKIAKKHKLDNMTALKAVYEYKKFVFLGIIADFYVTPSKLIDIVWHEHILFSKAYREFCNSIIETDFDHYPQLIAIEEQTEIYVSQYNKTLELYEHEFGIKPITEIWGYPKYDNGQLENPAQTDKAISRIPRYDNAVGGLSHSFSTDEGSYPEFETGGEFGGGGASGDYGTDSGDGGDSSDGGGCSGGCGGGD